MRVEILMSTYNGSKYLVEQIESIVNQQNIDIHLRIRDDGSTDNTVGIIEGLINERGYPITLYRGKNLGYRKSFLRLLELAGDADYYGFADQDDVWLLDKVQRAIDCIDSISGVYKLYASSVTVADGELNVIKKTDLSNMPNRIESYYIRPRLAGCTFLFTKEIKDMAKRFADLKIPEESMPDHDYVVGNCAFACGKVYIDNESRILHRRHEASVTSGGTGFVKRIKVEYDQVFRRKNLRYNMAKNMLQIADIEMLPEERRFLELVSTYKKSLKDKVALLFNVNLTSRIFVCDLEQKVKILLSIY